VPPGDIAAFLQAHAKIRRVSVVNGGEIALHRTKS
jgi:hypothetical protein